jgi:hypothetical protein
VLGVAEGQRNLKVSIGMQTGGIFEMAGTERAGLAQNGDDLVLGRNEVHAIEPFN